MEQNPPTPNHSPELPRISQSIEQQGGFLPTPEQYPDTLIERGRQDIAPESESVPPAAASVVPPVAAALPTPVLTTDDVAQDTTLPAVAADDDLIEKEWVTKAKKILEETKDDPYQREQSVKQLQADYLFKRYGRKLGPLK